LRLNGFDPIVLSLDSWLKDLPERGLGVLERYDLAAVSGILERLRGAAAPVEISVPVYDRIARKTTGETTLFVPPGAVVICEGAPALGLKTAEALRLAVAVDEETRRARFDSFYKWRGEAEQAPLYWRQRQDDEAPVIDALGASAVLFPKLEAIQP
jgi:anti-sigma factor RsiW